MHSGGGGVHTQVQGKLGPWKLVRPLLKTLRRGNRQRGPRIGNISRTVVVVGRFLPYCALGIRHLGEPQHPAQRSGVNPRAGVH